MCGIFAYIGPHKNVPQLIFDGLKNLEYRGYDSWGIAVRSDHKIFIEKHTGKLPQMLNAQYAMLNTSIGMGHTRWATHGGVTEINSHPHLDCSGNLALIHNGIIENYEDLKNSLLKKGHLFKSDTDSEVCVHLIEEYHKKFPLEEAVRLAFKELEGLNALIIINNSAEKIIAVKNGSPLVLGLGEKENFLGSDAVVFLPFTKKVYYLEDREMAVLTKNTAVVYDAENRKAKAFQPLELSCNASQVSKGNFPDYMLKEISEQPGLIAKISREGKDAAVKLAELINNSYGTYLVGCGSAAYAALAGTYLFSKIAKKHVNNGIGSEFSYQEDFLTDKSLLLALSQSGETMDTLVAVKNAKEKGTKIASLVNVLGSTLYRLSAFPVLLNVGPEKAVASTKALTAKLSYLLLISFVLADKIPEGQKILEKVSAAAGKMILEKNSRDIIKLAGILKEKKDLYVLGRGLSYPASLETALKIKEISYLHAEGLAAGELKHGPLALIEKGTPALVFLPDDETYGANLAGAMEVKARGGYIIGVSFKPHEIFDYYVNIPDAKEGTIILNIIFGQLLAYYLAVLRGLDPDKPRNLAKSVTVK